MQFTFNLSFDLKGFSPQLNNFVNVGNANVVFPTQTRGGNICSGLKDKDYERLSIAMPLLKQKATFIVANPYNEIQRNVAIYNLACSLGTCFILHHVDVDEESGHLKFVVNITTENKYDHDLFVATDRRFLPNPAQS